MIRCWPIFRAARAVIRHRRRHRIVHHAHRVAAAVVTKPAIIGWTCITVGAGWPATTVDVPPRHPAPPHVSPWPLPTYYVTPDLMAEYHPTTGGYGGTHVPTERGRHPVSEPESVLLLVMALGLTWTFSQLKQRVGK